MRVIDGDAHFIEPLDLFERYIDPVYRERAMQLKRDPTTGTTRFLVDQKPMKIFDVEAFLGAVVGYGQKEGGRDLGNFDRYLYYAADWQDMGRRGRVLGGKGGEGQGGYPPPGVFLGGGGGDSGLAGSPLPGYKHLNL